MKKLTLALSLSLAGAAHGAPARKITSEESLLWEVTSLAAANAHVYLALHGMRSDVEGGESRALLLEGNAAGTAWKRISPPEAVATSAPTGVLGTEQELFVIFEKLQGDRGEATLYRYGVASGEWSSVGILGECTEPQSLRLKGKRLTVECRGASKKMSFAVARVATQPLAIRLPTLSAQIGAVRYRYDEVSNDIVRTEGAVKKNLPPLSDLLRASEVVK